jgi:PIN domain nuclease of toxin-antitoxin system
MRYLIDTHILIWYINGDKNLSDKQIHLIENPGNKLVISIVSFWELTVKLSLNKLRLDKDLRQIEEYILERDFEILNISFDHLNTLSELPHHHKDPFDRLLIAQAITENLTIISADQHFTAYPVPVIQ